MGDESAGVFPPPRVGRADYFLVQGERSDPQLATCQEILQPSQYGGTHDTDVDIADDVVKLVDTNSPDTPDLETRAYESGTEDDGSCDTPPYDGESSVDGIPTIPDTLAAAGDDAGAPQKNEGGGGPSVQLPDTMEDEVCCYWINNTFEC